MVRLATLLVLIAAGVHASAPSTAPQAACMASPTMRAAAPGDPGASPIPAADWYVNADRSIWAGPVPAGGWRAGGRTYSGDGRTFNGQKTYWVRPRGTELAIGGRRLDASAPAAEAHIPCCYGSGFQIVSLYFPTEGCWEVTATSGASRLRFVTRVTRER
jgi:hypothetical protein